MIARTVAQLVVEGDKVYIERPEGRELQWGRKLIAKEVDGLLPYIRLVREGYEVADDEHEVQSEEDM